MMVGRRASTNLGETLQDYACIESFLALYLWCWRRVIFKVSIAKSEFLYPSSHSSSFEVKSDLRGLVCLQCPKHCFSPIRNVYCLVQEWSLSVVSRHINTDRSAIIHVSECRTNTFAALYKPRSDFLFFKYNNLSSTIKTTVN